MTMKPKPLPDIAPTPWVDMSKAHPKPSHHDFHERDKCEVCQGRSNPDASDQARHAAYVELRKGELLAEHQRKQEEHDAHQAELAHREQHQAVWGYPAPLTPEEIMARETPAGRVLIAEMLGLPIADEDVAAVRARAAEDVANLPFRAEAARRENRRQKIKTAMANLPPDARDAIDELGKQLRAMDDEDKQAERDRLMGIANAAPGKDPSAAATSEAALNLLLDPRTVG